MPRFKPPHWPEGVEYLANYRYAANVSSEVKAILQGTTVQKAVSKGAKPTNSHQAGNAAGPSSAVCIRKITTPTHPAFGQYGLFANKKIPPHSFVVEYLGEVHVDARDGSDYDLSLLRVSGKEHGEIIDIGVDANRMGNEGRFVNDYRGVRAKPNAMFKDMRMGSDEKGELRMNVWSAPGEGIKKGEEIVVSYGKAWWKARQTPAKADSEVECEAETETEV